VIVDLSAWGHIRVTGSDLIRFLQGLTTANVEALAPGGHSWGAILNPKGRVLSVICASRGADDAVIHCEPALIDKTRALLDRYAVMDDVVFERLDTAAHSEWTSPTQAWDAPIVLAAPPAAAASAAEVETARIEAGMPRYGVDVDEDAFPFETPLGRFLDYGKGCYIGQEPVFRVHARGQAARALRGLRVRGDAAPAVGARVVHPARPDAGQVTSAALSPRLGPIALAYLHRTAWDLGAEVEVDGKVATVVDLPFAV
jgi:tRNA-modifying protein YgfZ